MRDLGLLWQEYQSNRLDEWSYEKRVIVNGIIYEEAEIYEFTKQSGLIANDFTIGMCVSARFDVSLRQKQSFIIPKNAKVEPQTRIVGENGNTPWVTLGTYFINHRTTKDNKIYLECYDSMLYAEKPFIQYGDTENNYPMSASNALKRISEKIGVQLDMRNDIYSDVFVNYPYDLTMREVLGFIASAHAGNFYVTDDNTLRLAVVENKPSLFSISRGNMKSISISANKKINRLKIIYNSNNDFYEFGSGDNSLEISNPFATSAIAYRVYSKINNYTYNSVDVDSSDLDPALELSDPIDVDGMQMNLWIMRWDTRLYCDISSPIAGDLDSEFPFYGTTNSALSRRVSLNTDYNGTLISSDDGLKITVDDNLLLGWNKKSGKFDFNGHLGEDVTPQVEQLAIDVINSYLTKNPLIDLSEDELKAIVVEKVKDYLTKNPISGGHEIIDPDGFYLPQQPKLQFAGSAVTVRDDSENSTTLVEITSGSGGEHNHVYIDHIPTQDETWDVGTEVSVYDPDNSHLNAGVLYPITHSFIVVDKKNEIVEDLENFSGEILECFNTAPGAWRYYDGYPPDSRVIVAAKPGDIIEVSMMYAHTELSPYLADSKEKQEYVYIRIWPSMWLTEDWGGGERGFVSPAYGLGDIILGSYPWALFGQTMYGIATSANAPVADGWHTLQYSDLDVFDVRESIGTPKQIKKLTYKFTVADTGHFDEIVAYEKSKGTFFGDSVDYMLGIEVRACANILTPDANKPKDTVFWLYESKVTLNGVPIETANTNPFNEQGQLNVKYEGVTPDDRLFSSGQSGVRIISDSYKNEPWSRYPHLT